MLTSSTFVLALTIMYGLGFLAPIVIRGRRFAVDLALLCGLLGSTVAAVVTGGIAFGLLTPLPTSVIARSLWVAVEPFRELSWEIQVDPLAAFFGLLISTFAMLVAVYSFAALRADHYRGQGRHIAVGFNLFVWSTLLVVFASQGVVLLVALEAMTLAFGYLILYKHIYYLGVLPGQVTPWLASLAGELGYDARLAQPSWSSLALESVVTRDRPLLPIVALLGIAAGLVGISVALRPGHRAHRPVQPWNCGAPLDATTMQATSASVSDLIRHLVTDPTRPPSGAYEYLPARFVLSDSPTYPQAAYELFRETYNRWFEWLLMGSAKVGNAIQQGDIRRYLSYIFVASLAALFLFLRLRKP